MKKTNMDHIQYSNYLMQYGVGEILLTSMDKDGTKEGYDINALKKINEWLKIPIIASGGAGKLEHIRDAFLLGDADAALCASIFHFQEYTIHQVKEFLKNNNVVVRA